MKSRAELKAQQITANKEYESLENIKDMQFDLAFKIESIIALRNERFYVVKADKREDTSNNIEELDTDEFIRENVKSLKQKAFKLMESIGEEIHELID
jgi:hypothetical protein